MKGPLRKYVKGDTPFDLVLSTAQDIVQNITSQDVMLLDKDCNALQEQQKDSQLCSAVGRGITQIRKLNKK